MYVSECVCVCMFEHNSGMPTELLTKLGKYITYIQEKYIQETPSALTYAISNNDQQY